MTVNAQKKQAINHYESYLRSDMHNLDEAYQYNYSTAKSRAWIYCIQLMTDKNGYGLKVISKNSFMFTAGFEYVDEDTGVLMFMYITPNYDQAVEVQ